MGADRVAELLRSERDRVVRRWEQEARRRAPVSLQPQLPVLRDHAYELLDGLAAWIEGATDHASRAFAVIVEAPELQRLGYGLGLETLVRELGQLRLVMLRDVLPRLEPAEMSDAVLALDEAMDTAIASATSRFAQQREDVRDRFIAILGHDLREPLTTVLITARILGRHPKLRVHADRIVHASERMMRMVGDVLDFARGHLGGGIPARPAPHDLGEICRTVADEISTTNPDRRITVDLHGDLHANVDRDRAVQAITNLVSNAIEHGTGPIEITAYEADDRGTIVTSVTSHGEPIPASDLARIFDPFARADTALERPGLGLGLYIVQQIALAHGARCEASSSASGTTFAIRWPRGLAAVQRKAG